METSTAMIRHRRQTAPDPIDLAIRALGYMAEDPERLERFFALTGLSPAALRQASAEPGFGSAILDYLASDEQQLIAFAQAIGVSPQEVVDARERLARQGMSEEF